VHADKNITAAGLKEQTQEVMGQQDKEKYNIDLMERWKRKVVH